MPKGVLDPNHRNRCTAHKSGGPNKGERCKNAAIKGGTVCRYHGGGTKKAQKKARERFNDLVDPMINIAEQMVKEAEDGKLNAAERLGLMKFIADRTGFIAGRMVTLDGPPEWEGMLAGILKQVPDDFDPRAIGPSPYSPEDIEDAEVIEDEEEDDPRDRLPRIVPAHGADDRASVRIRSAEPPHRPGYRR